MKNDLLAQLADLLQQPQGVPLPKMDDLPTQQSDFTLDRVAGILYPASRQLSSEQHSFPIDTLALCQYIAQRQHIDLDTAQRQLADFIEAQRPTLLDTGMPLGPVGSLQLDAHDQLAFVIDPDHNLDLAHFGLPPITGVHPVLTSQERLQQEPLATRRTTRPSNYRELIGASMELKFLIAVIFLLALNIPIVYYIKYKLPPTPSVADAPKDDTPSATEQYIDYDAPEPVKPTPEVPSPTPTPPIETADEDSPKGNTPTPAPTTDAAAASEKHLIVLGVFSNKQNAESLQVTLFEKGYNPSVTALPSGAYRVGVLIVGDAAQVPKALETLRQTYKGAYWKQ